MRIGFIGLGNMGSGMARRLVDAKFIVTVYNRTRSKADDLLAAGAKWADSPAQLADASDVVVTMLSDDRAVEEVCSGSDGILDSFGRASSKGRIHVSMSTISTHLADSLESRHSKIGTTFVGAPVFGRPDAAAAGKLFIAAAGPQPALDQLAPVFGALSQKVLPVGERASAAHLTKILGNFMLISALESLAEALALAKKSGLDPQAFLDAMTGSLFTAPLYKNYGSMMISPPKPSTGGFRLPLALKDVGLALKASDAVGSPLPFAGVLRDQISTAVNRGYRDRDLSALGNFAFENAGAQS